MVRLGTLATYPCLVRPHALRGVTPVRVIRPVTVRFPHGGARLAPRAGDSPTRVHRAFHGSAYVSERGHCRSFNEAYKPGFRSQTVYDIRVWRGSSTHLFSLWL